MFPDILGFAKPIIDRLLAFIPDPQQKAAAKLQLFEAQQAGEFKALDAQVALAGQQTAIDQAEASSTDPMQHWRGGLGWVCAFAYGYSFVLQPLIQAGAAIAGHPVQLPNLELGQLRELTFGMLGLLGGMHVTEHVSRCVRARRDG